MGGKADHRKVGGLPPNSLRGRFFFFLLLLGLVFLLPGALLSGAEVEVVCLSPERTVAPRSVTTLAFRLTNLGADSDAYDLSFELPDGFSVLVAPDAVEVPAGEARVVLVSLFASAAAPAGDYGITLRAQSRTVPGHAASAVARVTVLPRAGVELRVPTGGQGWPGGTVTYSVWVINQGNALDSFRIEVSTAWRWELSPTIVHLIPGEAAEVTLILFVPDRAKPGDKGYCRVSARSVTDPDVSEEAGVWTMVIPPPPELIPVTLFPIVPITLKWTGMFTAGFSSKVSLTMGGTIAPERYLALSGILEVKPDGLSFNGGWLEYREAEWSARVGQLSFTTPVASVTGVGLRYSYHPPHCPYQVTLCQYDSKSLLHARLGLDTLVVDLYSAQADDLLLVAALKTDTTALRLELGNLVSISLSTHGSPAVSGSLSWGSGTTIGLSGACAPFSGRFSYTRDETYTRMLGGGGFSAPLLGDLSFRFSWEIERKRDENPASPLDTVDTQLSLGFSDRGRPLSWSLSATVTGATDCLLEVSTLTALFEGEMTLRFDPSWTFSLTTKLSQGGTGAVTSYLALGSSFVVPGGLHGDAKWVLLGEEECALSVSWAGLTIGLSRKPALFEVSFELRFTGPLPLVETMGRIEGVVFLDANQNGVQDPGERGLEGLLFQCDKEQALSGAGGLFRFYPMIPGTYTLRLLTSSPVYCPQPRLPLQVRLAAGEVKVVRIALIPAATLSGQVLIYRPANASSYLNSTGVQWVVDRPLAGARVVLTNGVESFTALTDARGSFFFQGLCPGTWTARVELPALSPPHYVEQDAYPLVLAPGSHHELTIRVLPKARTIRPLGTLTPPPSTAP